MEEFQINRWLLALVMGTLITLSFDSLFLYLSSKSFGGLKKNHEVDQTRRKFPSITSSGTGWHVLTNVSLVVVFSFLAYLVGQNGVIWMLIAGAIIGGMDLMLFIRMFSTLEVDLLLNNTLKIICILQKVVSALTAWVVYWA